MIFGKIYFDWTNNFGDFNTLLEKLRWQQSFKFYDLKRSIDKNIIEIK